MKSELSKNHSRCILANGLEKSKSGCGESVKEVEVEMPVVHTRCLALE